MFDFVGVRTNKHHTVETSEIQVNPRGSAIYYAYIFHNFSVVARGPLLTETRESGKNAMRVRLSWHISKPAPLRDHRFIHAKKQPWIARQH